MCTVLLSAGVNPFAVNIYISISIYNVIIFLKMNLSLINQIIQYYSAIWSGINSRNAVRSSV